MGRLIASRDEFFRTLETTLAEIDDLAARQPEYPVWSSLQQQLHAMKQWLAQGEPTPEQRANISIGLIAARELEPSATPAIDRLASRLHGSAMPGNTGRRLRRACTTQEFQLPQARVDRPYAKSLLVTMTLYALLMAPLFATIRSAQLLEGISKLAGYLLVPSLLAGLATSFFAARAARPWPWWKIVLLGVATFIGLGALAVLRLDSATRG